MFVIQALSVYLLHLNEKFKNRDTPFSDLSLQSHCQERTHLLIETFLHISMYRNDSSHPRKMTLKQAVGLRIQGIQTPFIQCHNPNKLHIGKCDVVLADLRKNLVHFLNQPRLGEDSEELSNTK